MRIFVKVKAGSREDKVTPPPLKLWTEGERSEEYFNVSVKAPPVEGKANDAVILALAEYFQVSRSQVRLVSGSTSKRKVFEIEK